MTRLCIICEGQTESTFVQNCLAPHLARHGIQAYSTLLQSPSGNHRGGRVTVERLAQYIAFSTDKAARFTTLVDYYGFQNADGRSRTQLEADILAAAQTLAKGRLDPRFVLPYVQMYEFEGLLFTEVSAFQAVVDGCTGTDCAALERVRRQFDTPEDINNSRETAPSKRIQKVFATRGYSKTEHGPLIASAIGLERIRAACPQFNEWVTKLEAWAPPHP